MSERIPLTRPLLGAEELRRVREVLWSGQLVQGARVAAFEEAVRLRLACSHAVAVGSGTDAIHLACRALGVGPGDEVVVPDFCFPSVAAAVIHTGAVCVLCDVDPETSNIDLPRVEAAMTPATRAVIAVHQFGHPCAAAALEKALSCPVIEDAACSFGGTGPDGPYGTRTTIGCFSFHPRKVLTTAEGGLVATSRADLADRCRWLRAHGMRPGESGVVFEEVGLPARMSEVHAAIGLAQMERLDGLLAGRARSAALYRERLCGVAAIRCPPATWAPDRVYQSLVVFASPGVDRDRLVAKLRTSGVESTIGTYAIHRLEAFAPRCRVSPGGLGGSAAAARQSLTLPLWPDMPVDVVDRVVRTLKEVAS